MAEPAMSAAQPGRWDSRLGELPALARADPWLVRRGQHLDLDLLLGVGDQDWVVTVRQGRVERAEPSRLRAQPCDLAIRASTEAWAQFWQPTPPPQRSDIFALMRHGMLRLEGDLHLFYAHLLWIKALLALPRQRGPAA